jgi:cryptochrome
VRSTRTPWRCTGNEEDAEIWYLVDTIAGPDKDFAVPTLESLGLGKATTHIRGGETEALRRLQAFLDDAVGVATFSKPKSSPNSLEPSTTLLSPYLKFGCMSVRKFYWDSQDVCDKYAREHKGATMTKEPENLAGQVSRACRVCSQGRRCGSLMFSPSQLEFRDMYYCAEYATAKYERIEGNSLSR